MHKERGYRGYKAGGTKKRRRERGASHASGAPRAFRSTLRKLRGRERMFNPVLTDDTLFTSVHKESCVSGTLLEVRTLDVVGFARAPRSHSRCTIA